MCSWQLADYAQIPRISCVYSITHEVSGREYIGRSVDLRDRARKHWQEMLSSTHKNQKMMRTRVKYGDAFIIKPLVIGDSKYCTYIEGKLLETIDLKESLNCHRNSAGGWLGMKFSDETRARLSAMRMGKAFSDGAKERQRETRKNSVAWKAHQDWMQTPEAIAERCAQAAKPETRAKAVATRRANGHKPFGDEVRQLQRDESKARVFAALDWAVANDGTRDAALKKFSCSWDGLKKYQPEWESIHGPLAIPKRASGEKNGKVKWAKNRINQVAPAMD